MEQIFESVKEIEKKLAPFLSSDENTAEFLMIENAAASLEKQVDKFCSKKNNSVIIMCGSGNNGADGYTLARRIERKHSVCIIMTDEPSSYCCKKAFKNIKPLFDDSIKLFELKEEIKNSKIEKEINGADVIVDCIFGTGFHGLVEQKIQNLFKIVNHSDAKRIACDIPSGIEKTCGSISGFSMQDKKHHVFCADVTVSMGAFKTGLFCDDAKDFVGKIIKAGIGVSSERFTECAERIKEKIFLLEKSDAEFPERNELNTHKGKFGHVCVVTGEKKGAGVLCASSAFKCGAGLSSILVKPDVKSKEDIEIKMPACLMVCDSIPQKTACLVAGPGFGCDGDIKPYLDYADKNCVPIVLDADSFYYKETADFIANAGSGQTDDMKSHKIVLTPHPKEFSELLKICALGDYSVSDVAQKRLELVRLFCQKYQNAVLILKGANTFIGYKNNVYICDKGSPALSKGGSGDVLAGAVAGLLAQGYDALDAAVTGVLMHALASTKFKKTYALTPEALIEEL
ncbi:MAG: NAD(P)H-hydrate dehydratase [Treponema sp.]|uniref:NAD(P)H-hydrate dehydratase n=1 Tax=Treponema sp. TaxID=166 RepID=UPI00298D83F6|nr:NAD(P)H-hydrate dehydratase [Treponema sp.]MBR5933807.1 NAD(P)H-hydrate dehydratase [Treponema sp.]